VRCRWYGFRCAGEKSDDDKKAIGDGVYRAMREVFNVPDDGIAQ